MTDAEFIEMVKKFVEDYGRPPTELHVNYHESLAVCRLTNAVWRATGGKDAALYSEIYPGLKIVLKPTTKEPWILI